MQEDVDLGLRALEEGKSLAFVSSGRVLATGEGGGIRPFFQAIDVAGDMVRGSTLVDRVAGRAVALLSLHYGVIRVHAMILSRPGLDVLRGAGIPTTYGQLVDLILNRDESDMCPVERMARDMETPRDANERLRAFVGMA